MASYKNFKLRKMLLRKGFKEVNTDHKMLIFHHQGKKTAIHTKVSHGIKDIGDPLIGPMAKQIHLSKSQFKGVIECSVKKDDLIKIYSEQGLL